MAFAARPAHTAFVFFDIPGIHAGESARVAEQIVCANLACTGLDYQFYVLNTGVVPIDGVAFGLGVVNAAAQIGAGAPANLGGALTFATAPGGVDGPFPAAVAGFLAALRFWAFLRSSVLRGAVLGAGLSRSGRTMGRASSPTPFTS
jgi:hypothetical protein